MAWITVCFMIYQRAHLGQMWHAIQGFRGSGLYTLSANGSHLSHSLMPEPNISESSNLRFVGNAPIRRIIHLINALTQQVKAIHFKAGDKVGEGDVMLEIENHH